MKMNYNDIPKGGLLITHHKGPIKVKHSYFHEPFSAKKSIHRAKMPISKVAVAALVLSSLCLLILLAGCSDSSEPLPPATGDQPVTIPKPAKVVEAKPADTYPDGLLERAQDALRDKRDNIDSIGYRPSVANAQKMETLASIKKKFREIMSEKGYNAELIEEYAACIN